MHPIARLILPLCVFVIGLSAGAWFSIERRAARFSTAVAEQLAKTGKTALATSSDTPRESLLDEKTVTEIMSAVAEHEPLLRAHRLHKVLGRLSAPELAVFFERAVRLDDR